MSGKHKGRERERGRTFGSKAEAQNTASAFLLSFAWWRTA